MLEIASGTGEHVVHFAAALPHLAFQPSDPDPQARASIDAWTRETRLENVQPAVEIDVTRHPWPEAAADAVLCINMIHIAPWPATAGLMRGAGAALPSGGLLILYGPFRRGGAHTAASNAAFDASLKARDPRWGVRDIEDVIAESAAAGFRAPVIEEMPANNLCLLFSKL